MAHFGHEVASVPAFVEEVLQLEDEAWTHGRHGALAAEDLGLAAQGLRPDSGEALSFLVRREALAVEVGVAEPLVRNLGYGGKGAHGVLPVVVAQDDLLRQRLRRHGEGGDDFFQMHGLEA